MVIQSGYAMPNILKQRLLKAHPNPVEHPESSTGLNETPETADSFQRSSIQTVLSRSHTPELDFDKLDYELKLDFDKLDHELDPFFQVELSDMYSLGNPVKTQQNPFHHKTEALPPQTVLPEKQSQQPEPLKTSDFDKQQTSKKKMKRPSRHPLYQAVLTSEQTDDELESTDKEVLRKAKHKIYARKSRQTTADNRGITVTELYRQRRQASRANKRGINP